MARPSNREVILDAFEKVLIAGGETDATLETIAEVAGLSKGGLLYHFGTKDELFAAFGARLLARIDAIIAEAPTDPGGLIRWYLDPDPVDVDESDLWRTILAALHSTDAGIAGVIRDAFARYAEPLDALEPTLAEEVRLIGDGLFLGALVGIEPAATFPAIVDELAGRAGR